MSFPFSCCLLCPAALQASVWPCGPAWCILLCQRAGPQDVSSSTELAAAGLGSSGTAGNNNQSWTLPPANANLDFYAEIILEVRPLSFPNASPSMTASLALPSRTLAFSVPSSSPFPAQALSSWALCPCCHIPEAFCAVAATGEGTCLPPLKQALPFLAGLNHVFPTDGRELNVSGVTERMREDASSERFWHHVVLDVPL